MDIPNMPTNHFNPEFRAKINNNEHLYRNIYNASSDAIIIYDKQGNIVDANPAASKIYGYSYEELTKLSGKDIIHPDYRERFENFINTFTLDSSFIAEGKDIRKDGVPLYVEAKGTGFIHSGDLHLVVFIRDMTARNRAAEQLAEYRAKLEKNARERSAYLNTLLHFSEQLKLTTALPQLYRRITQIAKDVLRLDFSTLMILTDDKKSLVIRDAIGFPETMIGAFSLVEGHGLSTHVVVNKKPAQVFDFKTEKRFEVPPVVFEKNISSSICVPMMIEDEVFGVLIGHTHECRRFNGEEIALYQSLGNQSAIAIKNVQHLQALEKSETKFRTIFDNASDAIFIVDLNGKILEANQIACDNLGYTRQEILEMTCADIEHPDFHAHAQERTEQMVEDGQAIFETAHIKKDDSAIPIELHGRLIQFNDNPAILGVARDISERKQMESYLLHAQKMEAIGTLAGGVAHDFNNILYAIMGYAEMSMLDVPEYSPLRKNLEEIVKAGKRAGDLVKQILSFSRKAEEKRQPLQLQPIIKETLKLLKGTLPATIEIKSQLDRNTGVVLGDPTQLHQIIMNLCTNAYQAMRDEGGVLTVSLDDVAIADNEQIHPDLTPGDYIKLSVRDTGAGMDPKIMERIFDPYFTTKELGEGTGLGLATVHGIVKSHHGVITVESQPGQGTCFDIYLPVVRDKQAVPEDSSLHELPKLYGKVLFVDDEQMIKEIGEKTLQQMGCDVDAFTDSIEALKHFQKDPDNFDLVITDLTMPMLTGNQLALEILSLRPDIPIVLTTGYSDLIDENHALELGIKEFILKPLTLQRIAEMAEKYLPPATR